MNELQALQRFSRSIHWNRLRCHKLAALRFHARAYLHGHSVGGTNPSLLEGMGCSNLVIAHDNRFNREVLGDAVFSSLSPESLACLIDQVDSHRLNLTLLGRIAAKE